MGVGRTRGSVVVDLAGGLDCAGESSLLYLASSKKEKDCFVGASLGLAAQATRRPTAALNIGEISSARPTAPPPPSPSPSPPYTLLHRRHVRTFDVPSSLPPRCCSGLPCSPLLLRRPATPRYRYLYLYLHRRPLADSSSRTATIPADFTTPATSPIPYFIYKSKTGNYPIYHETKLQGPKLTTRIRKLEGNLAILKEELEKALSLEAKDVEINHLTRHIIIKGHRKFEVEAFLKSKGF